MFTTISEIDEVLPWLSPVVLEHSGGDKALYEALYSGLPSALKKDKKEQGFLVHVTPGVLQLQCKDLAALDKKWGEEAVQSEPESDRVTSELVFRQLVDDLYRAVQSVLDELHGQVGWECTDRLARRLLAEPALYHSDVVVNFLQNSALTRADFDFTTVSEHRERLIAADVPFDIFHRLITAYDDVLGAAQRERKIRFWSAKSRRRLLKACSELDWAPVLDRCEGGQWQMAMVTITYPGGDWLRYAPDAHTAHAHFKALQSRFFRTWGVRMQGIWKREFQKRRAPHLHILMPVPTWGVERDSRIIFFEEWLGWAFAEIVGAKGIDFLNHANYGTRVDRIKAFSSIKNIAGYFLKYAGKRGRHASKEYQNIPPYEWSQSDKGVGRFWGRIGVERVVRTVVVSRAEFVVWSRTLRRMVSAHHPHSRLFRGNGGAGWLLTEEFSSSVSIVKNLARLLQCCSGDPTSPPVGMRGSVMSRLVVA